jgi:fructose-1,6-bisphosphatase/inositol monophosphatase family enzyme
MAADPRSEISLADRERFLACALALADTARREILAQRAAGFEVKRKSDGSFVTSADVQVETRLRERLAREFPAHGVLGEELPTHLPAAEFQWIFDPIDGTEDFVQGIPTFGSIIGLHFRGAPLAGVIDVPLLDARVHAGHGLGCFRGTERLRLADLAPDTPPGHTRIMLAARANFARHPRGGAAFDALTRAYPNQRIYRTCYAHLLAATGQIDAMIEYGNKIWDLAAARILIEEAGGAFRTLAAIDSPDGTLFAAAFGRPTLVARLATLLETGPS